jgi:hypothetical protein
LHLPCFSLSTDYILQLWKGELELVAMDKVDGPPQGHHWTFAARKLEIFLDYLASETASSVPHLLNDKFEVSTRKI